MVDNGVISVQVAGTALKTEFREPMFGLDYAGLAAFGQVIMIDLVLAADNAIVIGLAAAGLAPDMRRKAILIGIIAATVLRIIFALATTWLLQIVGLILIGGILLLWVCWKMYRELHTTEHQVHEAEEALMNSDSDANGTVGAKAGTKTLRQAVVQIIIADVSMSLDNVLAVAGAAKDHFWALIFGLGLSVVLMGAASAYIAKLLNRFRWIAWVGFAIILFVAIRMVYEGADQVLGHTLPAIPLLKSAAAVAVP
ncbi:MAG: Integral rane protein TerC family [Rhizobium sp.]|nr:Integral rane protein TerC family [Rhizobium sp.]